MAKQIKHGEDARRALEAGLDTKVLSAGQATRQARCRIRKGLGSSCSHRSSLHLHGATFTFLVGALYRSLIHI